MSQYILDTDHISLILRNHPQVIANASRHSISVTIITVQELFNGWMGKINDPWAINNLPQLYSKLSITVIKLSSNVSGSASKRIPICAKSSKISSARRERFKLR